MLYPKPKESKEEVGKTLRVENVNTAGIRKRTVSDRGDGGDSDVGRNQSVGMTIT